VPWKVARQFTLTSLQGPHCLSQFSQYNDLTSITAGRAFIDTVITDLKPYIASPLDYAQLYYTAITDDDLLNNLALTVIMGDQNLVGDILKLSTVVLISSGRSIDIARF
jgi:hypothetical protein